MPSLVLHVLLWVLTLVSCLPAPSPLPPHPRLLLTPDRVAAITTFIKTDAQARSYFDSVTAQAAAILPLPPVPWPSDGNALIPARMALVRTYVLGLMWRLTMNETFAARGVAELQEFTTQWPNWQPVANQLVMGELSHATAIGLDWFHDFLSAADREAITAGLLERGLAHFAAVYASGGEWWTCTSSNWCSVTNSGAGLAALALLGEAESPPWVDALLVNATQNVKCSVAAPPALGTGGGLASGVWWEGPMYSGYTLSNFLPFAMALGAVTGDTSLLDLPGLTDAPLFQVASMDAQWRYFNWADSEETQETLAMLLSTAERSGEVGTAYALRARLDSSPVPPTDFLACSARCALEFPHALLYFSAAGGAADRDALPLDIAYPQKMLTTMRSGWGANDTFVGFRAGSNCSWGHGDLDAGSFVYTWGGVRWVSELGADNYGLPGYFGGGRFQWYRKNSRGHNTLQFNGTIHDSRACVAGTGDASAPASWMAAFSSTAPSARVFPSGPTGHPLGACPLQQQGQGQQQGVCAVCNMTGAFALQGVAAANRTLALDEASRTTLLGSDRWALLVPGMGIPPPPPTATASLHTFATQVTLDADGQGVVLQQGGLAVCARLGPHSPCTGAVWALTQVSLAAPQNPTDGLTRVDVTVDPRTCSGLDVIISPRI
jgi:hypothetical protein